MSGFLGASEYNHIYEWFTQGYDRAFCKHDPGADPQNGTLYVSISLDEDDWNWYEQVCESGLFQLHVGFRHPIEAHPQIMFPELEAYHLCHTLKRRLEEIVDLFKDQSPMCAPAPAPAPVRTSAKPPLAK